MLVADDLGWRDSGPYGNSAVGTPHIDRLARSGLLVQRAFGTTPQCSPSRVSILSGRYPHATRAEDLHTPLPASARLLPSYLQADGYYRVRDDNTDRVTGVQFTTRIPPLRNPDVPPLEERWGSQGPR